jgi:O-succinylbenzoate synthase
VQPITLASIHLHEIALPFVEPLRTSFGEEPFKSAILVELTTSAGVSGWGEVSTEIHPGYSSETMGTARHVLNEFLVPLLLGKTISSPTDIPALIGSVRGHPMAKHGMEAAAWDAWARTNGLGLADAFAAHLPAGHTPRGWARVGVSIGIKPSVEATCEVIQKRLDQGYGRIKLKIKPGWEIELARGVRQRFPDISLMLDANSAYTLADADTLKQLDQFDLLMIEQPLGYDDIYEHRLLQPQLRTPICLDESILSADDARMALELGACKIINLKPARVGGYTESLAIYLVCAEQGAPLWVGGMMETGVGRAANLAFASLPGVTLPCDISATDRYFDPDVTNPPFVIRADSTIAVAAGVGIGVQVVRERVEAAKALWRQQYPYSHGG